MASTTGTLRFGLIGCGDIGRLRVDALARSPGCKLSVVADADQNRARSFAQGSDVAVADDWRALVAREDVDAVLVCTPPRLHAEMCIGAAEHGKHVLCEKPLAFDADEARSIVAAGERYGVRIATGFNYRFYPSFAKAKAILADGRIGRIDHIRSFGGYSATSHNQAWVHDVNTVGGGAMRDVGIHLLDLTRDMLGDVVDVQGMSTDSVWQYPGCEDNGFALLRSSTGVVATVQASWTEWRKYRFSIDVYGSLGCLRATCFPMMTDVRWSTTVSGTMRKETDYFPRSIVNEKLHSYRRIVVDSFVLEHAAFRDYVAGHPSRIASARDGLRALEIVEAATGIAPLPVEAYPANGAS
ncbi:MAG: Myo-inositol 2-dehydrogenase [Gemmatimonadaceae bacterium]|nr:Myo-inositol 2-dehydrogenase [Gemmatimonadaceae bacterium]